MYIARYVTSFYDGIPLSQCERIAETKQDLIAYLKADGYGDDEIGVGETEYGWQIEQISFV
jgi:hypothetical protein